jgi:hypothetical protein
MLKKNKEILFFVLVFLLFFISVKVTMYKGMPNVNKEYVYIGVGLAYALILASLYFALKVDSEGFWDITPGAMCKGGMYMMQGDSEEAKMCRQMAETPEGRCAIASYNCAKGLNGVPSREFVHTNLSDDNYQNTSCDKGATCGCSEDTGMCGDIAYT